MTGITALLFDVDGRAELRRIDNTNLTAYQAAVGGHIEAITPAGGRYRWTAYLHEEGKLAGLPVNVVADHVARHLGWDPDYQDVLVGPVLFVGPPDPDGCDTSLTDALAARLTQVAAVVQAISGVLPAGAARPRTPAAANKRARAAPLDGDEDLPTGYRIDRAVDPDGGRTCHVFCGRGEDELYIGARTTPMRR